MKNQRFGFFLLVTFLFVGLGCKGPSIEEVLTQLEEEKTSVVKLTEFSSMESRETVDSYFSYLTEITARTIMVDVSRKKFGKWVKSKSLQDFCDRYVIEDSVLSLINSSCERSDTLKVCGDEVYAYPKIKLAVKKMLIEQGVDRQKEFTGWLCLD